ncbi:relaxase/mobilization nuclease domain-containing protein [Bacillus sp. FDAARGOS_1420]|uniref:relaxase/mobilization nuclease domain-containing protein n=1 Tax=Bacillus sp. FDAARGOS_1420 TaxID=2856338 RepID=UPI001C5B39FB|nr:relaxase/mobilization nuclease domain-containing protein [Bacillus sp. FDAARGOS_1420]MBW3496888.1 relaxase/mobilization nuclease domain-containing protein [Bacillus sp. FDAARGOS_1420]MBW3496901.1 relaxase/mobilization nuclease domain-containing protein [Bacillus sp. FDAARGOS_1420]
MATIKLGKASQSAVGTLKYCEQKAVVKSGKDCNVEFAQRQFKTTRDLFGQDKGRQAYMVIQSFKPGEVTAESANEIGLEFAEKCFKGHEVTVYTHTDKEHIHNHLVVNSVHFETGRKLQINKKDIYELQAYNDQITRNKGLFVLDNKEKARERYVRTDYELHSKGKMSYREEIKNKVLDELPKAMNITEFIRLLVQRNIEIYEFGKKEKKIGYKLIDKEGNLLLKVSGKKLGQDYERGTIVYAIEQNRERGRSVQRTFDWGSVAAELENQGTRISERTVDGIPSEIQERIRETKQRVEGRSQETRRDNRENEERHDKNVQSHVQEYKSSQSRSEQPVRTNRKSERDFER